MVRILAPKSEAQVLNTVEATDVEGGLFLHFGPHEGSNGINLRISENRCVSICADLCPISLRGIGETCACWMHLNIVRSSEGGIQHE